MLLRRGYVGGICWESSEKHLRGIWEASERHPRGINREASGRHLGGIHLRFSPPARNMNKKRYKGSGFLNYRYSAQICHVSFDISWNFVMEANILVENSRIFMFSNVFDPSWPTKKKCDTSGTAAGHFYRSGTPILLPWTPNGNLLGLLWAFCTGQFDPPGPMLENYRKKKPNRSLF